MEVLVFVLLVLIALAIGLVVWHRRQQRRHDIGAFALSNGLEFSASDPYDLPSLPLRLFRKGDGRGAENVLWGQWGGEGLTAFDHWYYEESTSSDGGTSRTGAGVIAPGPLISSERREEGTR